jgi:hypothetical protein
MSRKKSFLVLSLQSLSIVGFLFHFSICEHSWRRPFSQTVTKKLSNNFVGVFLCSFSFRSLINFIIFQVYGYVTNTNIKFIVVVESSNVTLRDNEIRQIFRKLRDGYTDVLWNPFYVPGNPIKSKKFDAVIAGVMVPRS